LDDKQFWQRWFYRAFGRVYNSRDDGYFEEWIQRFEDKGLIAMLAHMDSNSRRAFMREIQITFDMNPGRIDKGKLVTKPDPHDSNLTVVEPENITIK